ncbi:surface carbohydrate biosynthesis protein [Pseudodesulfovibrio methanolicus]|uniref:Surface carbohydrate biosynthesis protein n=1 Tax=Pseudodesulfovibrio methanolicus TaxID=3126690 RepID=A0ABZ2ISC0_9BACT
MLCAFEVEILIRELDGVLYQALHLARKGLPSLVGDRMVNRYIRSGSNPVLYFDSDQHVPTNRHVLDNHGVVLNLNAEGQGFVDDPPTLQANFAKIIDHVTAICLWGQKQADILAALIPDDRRDDLIVTGHPAFDLADERFIGYYRNPDIVREHGEDYILINTSFGMFNHEMGFDHYVKMLSRMDEWKVYGDPAHLARLKKRCAHQEKTALAMIELCAMLAEAHPDRHIIIRPHPAEDAEFYRCRTSDRTNIFVTKQGAAREWIASAAAVIHHDCTTGLEATLMGKLVLQYAPFEDIEEAAALMTTIGHRVTSPEEAIRAIDQGTMPEETSRELRARLAPYLANVTGRAAEVIAELAASHAAGVKTWLPAPLGPWGQAKCWRKYLSKLLRARQPGRNGRKVRYALNKFSRLRKEEVERRLNGLRTAEPELPEVDVRPLCLNTFLITPRP